MSEKIQIKVIAPNASPKLNIYGFSGWISGCTKYDLKGSDNNINLVSIFYNGVNPIPINLNSSISIEYDFNKNLGIGVQLNLNKLGESSDTGRCDNVCGIIKFENNKWITIGKSNLNNNLCGLDSTVPIPPVWDPPIISSTKNNIIIDISKFLINDTYGNNFINARFCSCSNKFPCNDGKTCKEWKTN